MAKRTKSKVNKSQAIRDYLSSNPQASPKDVAAALAEQGVSVTAGVVSTLRSNDKRKGGRKPGKRGRPPMASNGSLGVDSLIQAKKLADQMGGIGAARQALAALSKILGQ